MEDSKYQIGDIVTIKQFSSEDSMFDTYRFGLNSKMIALSGKSFKIEDIQITSANPGKIPDDGYCYRLENTGHWSWSSAMFEDPNGNTSSSNTESISAFIRKKKCPELDFNL